MSALKVAVLGASGIGKNHARWFAGHGCEIVSFLGSSPDKVALTANILHQTIGYAPAGYTSLEALLAETAPDAVCISNIPELHYEHAKACLNGGAHVLCEKPLVGSEAKSAEQIVAEGRELVELAGQTGLLLGTQMQYGVAAAGLLELTTAGADERPITDVTLQMETKNIHTGRTHEKLWVDLSPHPLSVLQKLGSATIDWDTVRLKVSRLESAAHFRVAFAGQVQPCHVNIVIGCNPDRQIPRRRCAINGRWVDYEARRNATGDFKAFYTCDSGRQIEMPDLVDSLIGNFVAACQGREQLIVTGADGAQNVEWQLGILRHRC